jgi:hypothetical protein
MIANFRLLALLLRNSHDTETQPIPVLRAEGSRMGAAA